MGFCINFSLGHDQHKLALLKAVKATCFLLWNVEKVIKNSINKAMNSTNIWNKNPLEVKHRK